MSYWLSGIKEKATSIAKNMIVYDREEDKDQDDDGELILGNNGNANHDDKGNKAVNPSEDFFNSFIPTILSGNAAAIDNNKSNSNGIKT